MRYRSLSLLADVEVCEYPDCDHESINPASRDARID